MIPFGGFTQNDSIKISVDFYNIMTTCPVYLNECEELRRLDSLKIVVTENELNNMTYNNIQLKGRVNKLRGNVVKFSVLSFAVGILTTIFVLK